VFRGTVSRVFTYSCDMWLQRIMYLFIYLVMSLSQYTNSWITNTFIIHHLLHVSIFWALFRDAILILQESIRVGSQEGRNVYENWTISIFIIYKFQYVVVYITRNTEVLG
jgi:hypothetical protein